jgi:hypothetical protein
MSEREKPTIMRVRDAATGQMKAMRQDDIKTGERRHEKLPPDLEAQADELFPRVGKIMGHTIQSWRDGFCYDMHPDREIKVWGHIANVADRLWVDQPKVLKNLDRATLTRLVVAASTGMVDIPSQIKGVTDAMVDHVRGEYAKP